IERDTTKNLNGVPGISQIPFLQYLSSDISKEVVDQELLIVLTPHVIRFPSISADDLRTLAAGTDTNVRVYRDSDEPQTSPNGVSRPAVPQAGAPSAAQAVPQMTPNGGGASTSQLRFDPANVSLKPGERTTLGLSVSNVNDLYSIPLLIHYNPAVVQVEEVKDGGFLSGGSQQIAIVQKIDEQRGEVVVSATRQPNTPGVNGSGTLIGLVVRGVAPGSSDIQVLQVNARNSQQQNIPMVSGAATIRVQ
ncbi:MAG: cohesin domain-containing protein, partial [Terracidiphilus sp.]